MKVREVKQAAHELLAMPRLVNNALAMAFTALFLAATALCYVILTTKGK